MLQVLVNFLTFNALNTPPEVYFGLAAAWALLLVAGCSSIFSQRHWWLFKVLWLLMVIGVPILGLLLYCAYCLFSADYGTLKMMGLHKQTASQLRTISQAKS
jgi:hypothetical protein